jgi:hypothetical protein
MKNWDTELDKEIEAYKSWKERFGGLSRDMTLRDYFAAKALQAILPQYEYVFDDETASEGDPSFPELLATDAYVMADAMLKVRGQ